MKIDSPSLFERIFDVVVLGAGYAGYAAASSLKASGLNVLLVDTRGDLLSESGRSFVLETGNSAMPEWRAWLDILKQRQAASEERIDGALAEVLTTHQLIDSKADLLYYVCPVAVEKIDNRITSMIVATKSGPRRVVGRKWLDATESGLLARLSSPEAVALQPYCHDLYIYLERNHWPLVESLDWEGEGMQMSLHPTLWEIERCLKVTVPGDVTKARPAYLTALRFVRNAAPDLFSSALVTHLSVEPFPQYRAEGRLEIPGLPVNLAMASPSFTSDRVNTLADRFELGIRAALTLASAPGSDPGDGLLVEPIASTILCESIVSDVVVAGAGTGGALASLAAARQGVSVTSFDLLAFPGGIGSGGGIHVYYYGVPGGLQNELDDRVRAIQTLFGPKGQILGFHPDSKKLVLNSMFEEVGIRFLKGSMIYEVITQKDRIVTLVIATPTGPVRLQAHAWIDGTGDGDLSAFAGATYQQGRDFDGLMHAYTQSSGQVEDHPNGERKIILSNYDAGWCDSSDPVDSTRARLWGIAQYLRPVYTGKSRPTYIAPALGYRQLRQIDCDVMLTLGDFIERRRFEDCIAFAAGHYDSHIRDFEFESDEALFWVWFTQNGFGKSACEISYRMLIPKKLENVWIASRAAGRTHDAQFPVRMQRDMQRIGEVCGIAAALAVKGQLDARHIPLDRLRGLLSDSGALDVETASKPSSFRWEDEDVFSQNYACQISHVEVEAGLQSMAQGEPTANLWHIYRAGEVVKPRVLELLSSPDPMVSWLAAGVLAIWGDSVAESRLIEAIGNFEDGFSARKNLKSIGGVVRRPENYHWFQYNWVIALSLLRMCGTQRCVETLEKVAAESDLPFNLRTTIAVTLVRLAERNQFRDPVIMERILQRLATGRMPGRYSDPQRQVSQIYQAWQKRRKGESVSDSDLRLTPPHLEGTIAEITGNREDHFWQLQLALAKARLAVGLKLQAEIDVFKKDPRLFVKQAFRTIFT